MGTQNSWLLVLTRMDLILLACNEIFHDTYTSLFSRRARTENMRTQSYPCIWFADNDIVCLRWPPTCPERRISSSKFTQPRCLHHVLLPVVLTIPCSFLHSQDLTKQQACLQSSRRQKPIAAHDLLVGWLSGYYLQRWIP